MKFHESMIGVGIGTAVLGLIIFIFQSTLYVLFNLWYSFSLLDLLQRAGLRDWFYTRVVGFDDDVDWLLSFPLPVILIVLGAVIGLFAFKARQDEKIWRRRL